MSSANTRQVLQTISYAMQWPLPRPKGARRMAIPCPVDTPRFISVGTGHQCSKQPSSLLSVSYTKIHIYQCNWTNFPLSCGAWCNVPVWLETKCANSLSCFEPAITLKRALYKSWPAHSHWELKSLAHLMQMYEQVLLGSPIWKELLSLPVASSGFRYFGNLPDHP